MKILALAKYGSEAASTRQRILQYESPFAQAGIDLDCEALLPDAYVRSLARGGTVSRLSILSAYWDRIRGLLGSPRHDVFWIYADLFPYLPSAFDRLLFRHGRPVVIEWDDAFFELYAGHRYRLVRWLFSRKLDTLLSTADAIICGNRYLYDYTGQFCAKRLIVPTVVDTDDYRPLKRDGPLTIGWIGSPSTWPNCRPILPLIAELCERFDARFRVVGAGRVPQSDRLARFEFADWTAASEIAEVQSFDIGIMPLIDAPFQRGKSGYKLVQYMACGVPSVASPVGVNAEMLGDGSVGFLASTDGEWREGLSRLLADPRLRSRLGEAARTKAVAEYSLESQAPRLIALFKEVVRR